MSNRRGRPGTPPPSGQVTGVTLPVTGLTLRLVRTTEDAETQLRAFRMVVGSPPTMWVIGKQEWRAVYDLGEDARCSIVYISDEGNARELSATVLTMLDEIDRAIEEVRRDRQTNDLRRAVRTYVAEVLKEGSSAANLRQLQEDVEAFGAEALAEIAATGAVQA